LRGGSLTVPDTEWWWSADQPTPFSSQATYGVPVSVTWKISLQTILKLEILQSLEPITPKFSDSILSDKLSLQAGSTVELVTIVERMHCQSDGSQNQWMKRVRRKPDCSLSWSGCHDHQLYVEGHWGININNKRVFRFTESAIIYQEFHTDSFSVPCN
jgi:hypothetical protein